MTENRVTYQKRRGQAGRGVAQGPNIKVAGDKAPQGPQTLQLNTFAEYPHSSPGQLGLQLSRLWAGKGDNRRE